MRPAFFLALLAFLGGSAYGGANFNLDHLELASFGGDFMATERAGGIRAWEWRAGAAYLYDDSPLVLEQGGVRRPLVGARSLLEVSGAIELGRWVGLGLALPLLLNQGGSAVLPGAALGDLRLVPRVEIVRSGPVGLALIATLKVPTGDTNRFLGEGGVVFEPRLAVEAHLGMVRLGLNAGVRVRAARQYLDLTVGHEVFASLALAVVPRPWIDGFVELHGDTAMSSSFGRAQLSPVEALIGAAGGARGVRASAAVGFGLVDGFGASRVRAIVALEYRPPPPPPAPPRPSAPPPAAAPAPALLEPLLPVDDLDDEPGLDTPDVRVADGRIELADPVFFNTNSKRVRSRFQDELGQLARVLNRRPELGELWIEGHADATGPARWNQLLSRARAEQVVRCLVQRGVEIARLHPIGYGEARPLVPAQKGESAERNRRVHFFTGQAAAATVAAGGSPSP